MRNAIFTITAAIALWVGGQTGRLAAKNQLPGRLYVVTSTTDLAALTQEVGGDRVTVASLAEGYQDPHFVEPKPSFVLKLRRADLFIVIGLQLESFWLARFRQPSLLTSSGNARIQPGAPGYFDVSRRAAILDIPDTVSRAGGIHLLGNPHYWLDPENGRRIAQAITRKLSELRPNDGAYFKQRFEAFGERLTEKERAWQEEIRPYRGQKVISYHRTWSNFLQRFELISAGEIEPLPGITPNAGHTMDLIKVMKDANVKVIIVEPYFERTTPDRIARSTGAKILIMPASVGGESRVTDYLKLFDYNIDLLINAFQ